MCYVIVTCRNLLWCLLTIATTLCMLAAILTPSWLIGSSRMPGFQSFKLTDTNKEDEHYQPTLGIYNRCTKLHQIDQLFTDNCAPFVSSFGMPSDEFPNFWKASLVLLCCGLALMVFTVVASVLGCCFRSLGRKSIFTVAGSVQAMSGLLYVLGLVLYPGGWGSKRVQVVCGDQSAPYFLGDCTIGWAFYLAIASTIATFVCSALSIQAESSTASDKVQDEILEGKNLICVL